MERDRRFNFKLLVPSRGNSGQVSAVRPQDIVENCGDAMNTLQQGNSKGSGKEQSMPFSNKSVVAPTRPELPRMKVVLPMEKGEDNSTPGQLYSKLFDEVDKIKFWKVKVDSDNVQNERKLQENKRTIETQRKAIQELQFGNESLSVKLEEQISENEDLRNKNNATRNLCNILKDTFQRSAEKMHSFESEREETHNLFIENSGRIQKLIAAFESLRIQAEADQQETQKVKEALLQFEDLKVKYDQEYNMKEKEVALLQRKMKEKENELEKLLLDLNETQKHCKQLQETTNEQNELLKSSKQEQEFLLQRLNTAEQHCKETEKKREAIAATLAQSREELDLSLQELTGVKNQQADKLEEIQTVMKGLQDSLALEIQRTKELEDKLMANNKELERRNTHLERVEQCAEKDGQIKVLKDELDNRSKWVESMKGEMQTTKLRVEELAAELSRKTEEVQLFQSEAEIEKNEQDRLKKTCEAAVNAQEDLKKKVTVTEIKVQDLEEQLNTEMEKNKEQTLQMEQLRKDFMQQKLKYTTLSSTFDELQREKTAFQQQFDSGSSNVEAVEANMKVSEEKVVMLTKETQRLEEENQRLRAEVNSLKTKTQEIYQETETLQKKFDENCEHLQEEMTEKDNRIKSVETKLCNLRKKFETKLKAQEGFQKENKMLQKQLVKENAKSSQLQIMITALQEESENLKRLNNDHQILRRDLESKSSFVAELENELQKLRLAAVEAIKMKEDAEFKCQHKIADMVALMDKHKSQYDRMIEEKDAELDEKRRKVMEAAASRKSLELDLTKHKSDNDQMKQQLETERAKKQKVQTELSDLKKVLLSTKIPQPAEAKNEQSPASEEKLKTCSKTEDSALKRHTFNFSKSRRTPSAPKKKAQSDTESIRTSCGATPKTKEIHAEDLKTLKNVPKGLGGTSKIKSYRIMTPPSAEKVALWGRSTMELDFKSDSSDQTDLLTFASAQAPNFSSSQQCKRNIFDKMNVVFQNQSPVSHKSPGNSLKFAAMKRMRDAGWTAVTSKDKKKKTTRDNIFA
ncbi:synaptonemal complex protein 1 isoform X2 [Pungitius pungitius]|uniref:synaptonemal complex protein 1 isoform X2 n=1 Tax=Pungitius pungitius TaxID=134920 RepID=UPI002E0FEB7B